MHGFLSTQEAADILGVSRRHLRLLIERGWVEATRVGKIYLVDASSLENAERRPRRGEHNSPGYVKRTANGEAN